MVFNSEATFKRFDASFLLRLGQSWTFHLDTFPLHLRSNGLTAAIPLSAATHPRLQSLLHDSHERGKASCGPHFRSVTNSTTEAEVCQPSDSHSITNSTCDLGKNEFMLALLIQTAPTLLTRLPSRSLWCASLPWIIRRVLTFMLVERD
jgi:hypothetical protein